MNWPHFLALPAVGFALYAIVVFFLGFLACYQNAPHRPKRLVELACISVANWPLASRRHAMARDRPAQRLSGRFWKSGGLFRPGPTA
jgi:membrane protein DedA with SNARE-associated domain